MPARVVESSGMHNAWVRAPRAVRAIAALCAFLMLLVASAATRSAVPAGTFTPLSRDNSPDRSLADVMPRGVAAPLAPAGLHVRQAVAADIDTDGDIDLVALDPAYGLLVWTNDGQGHLLQQAPAGAHDTLSEVPGDDSDTFDAASESGTDAMPLAGALSASTVTTVASTRIDAPGFLVHRTRTVQLDAPRGPPSI